METHETSTRLERSGFKVVTSADAFESGVVSGWYVTVKVFATKDASNAPLAEADDWRIKP